MPAMDWKQVTGSRASRVATITPGSAKACIHPFTSNLNYSINTSSYTVTNMPNKRISHVDYDTDENDEELRSSFTPGWEESISKDFIPALPIKDSQGKIIQVNRIKYKAKISRREEVEVEEPAEEAADETSTSLPQAHHRVLSLDERTQRLLSNSSTDEMKTLIASICMKIIADPEKKFLIKHKREDPEEKLPYQHDMRDLLRLVQQDDSSIVSELAMLSARLVFQDILPSYKIRQTMDETSKDGEVRLKKETKRLLDYETSLLELYKSYLDILSKKVSHGFGSLSHPREVNASEKQLSAAQSLAYAAMKCQCELLRKLSHFNHREDLIASIVRRAASFHTPAMVRSFCYQTLRDIFEQDREGEVSYELLRVISNTLTAVKYHVPEELITSLEGVKLAVHMDKGQEIRKQVKKERRKRKRHHDEAEVAIMESNAVKELSLVQKHQVNCLKEIALIYFRIIKVKAGFDLFAVVLQGLGRISHLINIDMIEDLIPILAELVEKKDPSPPIHVKILCIHCVLRTIAGPGRELEINDDFFLTQLHTLILELPADYTSWHLVYEAVDLAYLQRRETRQKMIMTAIQGLCLRCPHLSGSSGSVGLALVHAILLRYPKIRIDSQILSNRTSFDCDPEEVVEDYAMKALKESASTAQAMEAVTGSDGTMIALLLKHAMDRRYQRIVEAMTMAEIRPVPYTISDAMRRDNLEAPAIEAALLACPKSINKRSLASANKSQAYAHGKSTRIDVPAIAAHRPGVWSSHYRSITKSISSKR
jgi:nucleolar complex protein 3